MRNNNYNKELGNWIKNYSINTYNEDYKLCVDLRYRRIIKNDDPTISLSTSVSLSDFE